MFDELRFRLNVRRLASRSSRTRAAGALALGETGDARALQPLLKCLRGRAPEAAAKALGMLGDPDAVEPLMGVAEGAAGETQGTRAAAASALGALADKRAIPTLVKALAKLGEPKCRRHALALRELRGKLDELSFGIVVAYSRWTGDAFDLSLVPEVITPELADDSLEAGEEMMEQLEEMLDRTALLRRAAAEALGAIGDAAAVPALLRGLGDPDGAARVACAQALGRLGQPQWAAWIQGDIADFVRLSRSGHPPAAIPIRAALRCPFDDVREAVRATLAEARASAAPRPARPAAAQAAEPCARLPVALPAPDSLGDFAQCPKCGTGVDAPAASHPHLKTAEGTTLRHIRCPECGMVSLAAGLLLPQHADGLATPAAGPA